MPSSFTLGLHKRFWLWRIILDFIPFCPIHCSCVFISAAHHSILLGLNVHFLMRSDACLSLQEEDKDKWYEAKRRKCEVRLIF